MRLQALASTLLFAGTSPLANAQTIVRVDDGPGGADHTEIEDAVHAATDGDLILVEGGTYAPFTVTGKSLVIVADQGADVRVAGTMRIEQVPAGGRVILHGLRTFMNDAEGLVVEDCAADVYLESCTFESGGVGYPGIEIVNSGSVYLAHTIAEGTPGSGGGVFGVKGTAGLTAHNTDLYIWSSTLAGKRGSGADEMGGAGGDGVTYSSGPDHGTLFVSSSRMFGGDGGWADSDYDIFGGYKICNPPGVGGDGIEASDPSGSLSVVAIDNLYAPGTGGPSFGFYCPSAPSGVPVNSEVAPVELVTPSPNLRLKNPVREGEAAEFEVEGSPTEFVVAAIGLSGQFAPLIATEFSGAILPAGPWVFVPMGSVPPEGEFTSSITGPQLPPGRDFGLFAAQAYGFNPLTSTVAIGAPTVLLVIDEQY